MDSSNIFIVNCTIDLGEFYDPILRELQVLVVLRLFTLLTKNLPLLDFHKNM